MYTLNLIRKKQPILDRIVSWIFILCGGNFYLNWILPTNPQSKNILIRKVWGRVSKEKYMGSTQNRLGMAYSLGLVHVIGALIFFIISLVAGHVEMFWHPINVLANLYPILVQLFIGYRCWRIQSRRRAHTSKVNIY